MASHQSDSRRQLAPGMALLVGEGAVPTHLGRLFTSSANGDHCMMSGSLRELSVAWVRVTGVWCHNIRAAAELASRRQHHRIGSAEAVIDPTPATRVCTAFDTLRTSVLV